MIAHKKSFILIVEMRRDFLVHKLLIECEFFLFIASMCTSSLLRDIDQFSQHTQYKFLENEAKHKILKNEKGALNTVLYMWNKMDIELINS